MPLPGCISTVRSWLRQFLATSTPAALHRDRELADKTTGRQSAMRASQIGNGKGTRHVYPNRPAQEQVDHGGQARSDRRQVLAVRQPGTHHLVVKRDAALECRQRCVSDSRRENSHHGAERLYHVETALESDIADGVEDCVYTLPISPVQASLDEVLMPIVDDPVRSELVKAKGGRFIPTRGSDYPTATLPRKLDGHMSHATGATVDQQRVPGYQLQPADDTVPSSHCNQWKGAGLRRAQVIGPSCYRQRIHGHKFRVRASALEKVGTAHDSIAYPPPVDAHANSCDRATEIVTERERKRPLCRPLHLWRTGAQVCGIYRTANDTDEHFAWSGLEIGQFSEADFFGSAVSYDVACMHQIWTPGSSSAGGKNDEVTVSVLPEIGVLNASEPLPSQSQSRPRYRAAALTEEDADSGLIEVAHVRVAAPERHVTLPIGLVVVSIQLGPPIISHEPGDRPESAAATITGLRSGPVRYDIAAGTSCLIAFCTLQFASRLLGGSSLAAIADARVPLHKVAPRLASLLDPVARARGDSRSMHWFLDALRRGYESGPEPGTRLSRALALAQLLMDNRGVPPLAEMAARWQVSRRMLEKDLADWLGASAGELQRLSRLQSALQLVRQPGIALADAAYKIGYADQSHLHRAIRRGTRMTPREWQSQPLSRLGALYQERIPGHHIVL